MDGRELQEAILHEQSGGGTWCLCTRLFL
jgi:hypothetical protein